MSGYNYNYLKVGCWLWIYWILCFIYCFCVLLRLRLYDCRVHCELNDDSMWTGGFLKVLTRSTRPRAAYSNLFIVVACCSHQIASRRLLVNFAFVSLFFDLIFYLTWLTSCTTTHTHTYTPLLSNGLCRWLQVLLLWKTLCLGITSIFTRFLK